MTSGTFSRPNVDDVAYDELATRFRSVFDRIAATAVERERGRVLPYEPVAWLREVGFGAVRIAVADGGGGASSSQFFELLIELGTADSNLPQLLRAHFGMVEERLNDVDSPVRDRWLRAVVDGAIIGNAVTEIGSGALGAVETTVSGDAENGWFITGTKHYSTGSLFADHIAIGVIDERGERAFALVDARHEGVELVDDWAGFGQRMTGSGTTVLDAVPVDPDDIFWFADRAPNYMIAFYQEVLLASLAGIGRAVLRDAVEFVTRRSRVFSHGSGATAREDPLVQQVVGQLSAASFAADAVVLAAAAQFDRLNAARDEQGFAAAELFDALEITVSRAHSTVVDTVLGAATRLFEVGGASSVDSAKTLDRHWRNARTISVHNPGIYKTRNVGDHLLNGAAPAYAWVVGVKK
ncbi:acyl-CoA dehydrogenase family protein [Subtercola lobariae]|uniref:Monooxygenase n=1 Tax=Subtercola lobariae TaxID=1588641 RepID=A0A917B523_9MICO|nr:acyl-CoA dehydrogenase family protein [Subtercola lobariae]GGF22355.1 monooxygenase [Subtercola lobariae]